jgi:hypothetical protein
MSQKRQVRRPVRRRTTALAVRESAENTRMLQQALSSGDPLIAFAALAKDKSVEPAKLEALVRLQERIMDRNAKAEFEMAFQAMKPHLPIIDRRGFIVQPGKAPRSYAKHEDIQLAIAPILAEYHFSLRFKTEWPDGKIRVVAILRHAAGHAETSEFEGEPDKTGDKNGTQARGSTISYGKRYTTCDVCNIVTKGQDTDGVPPAPPPAARPRAAKAAPKGDRPAPPAAATPPAARAGNDGQDARVISDPQRKRLWAIAGRAGRSNQEVKDWLAQRFKITSTNQITRGDYEFICNALESSAPLPLSSREPGQEG